MKYAVLLRGVNVGGRTVKSAELKSSFVNAGFKGAQTVIATGNVIVNSDDRPQKLTAQIEKFLLNDFKFHIKVCTVSAEKLTEIVENYPFKDVSREFHRYVIFTDESVTPKLTLDDKLEAVEPGDGVIYWRVLKGHTLDSDYAKLAAKQASKNFSTMRNINTLEKILVKMS